MLLFAHAGITLGAASALAGGAKREWHPLRWFTALSRYLDIRYLLIGSLLPDIIDKPVGQLLFRDTFGNGRIFSHTLLFLIVVSAFGFYLWKKHHQKWMLALAAGVFMHLVLDGMWETPATLFWPFMGWEFTRVPLENWARGIFHTLVSSPTIYVSEAIGLGIILWFAVAVIRRKKTGVFIRYGRIE